MLTANKTVSIFVSMHYTKFTPNRSFYCEIISILIFFKNIFFPIQTP